MQSLIVILRMIILKVLHSLYVAIKVVIVCLRRHQPLFMTLTWCIISIRIILQGGSVGCFGLIDFLRDQLPLVDPVNVFEDLEAHVLQSILLLQFLL